MTQDLFPVVHVVDDEPPRSIRPVCAHGSGKTWLTDLIDGICDPANGQRVLLWSSSLTRVLGWAHDDATPPRSVWLTTVDETGT